MLCTSLINLFYVSFLPNSLFQLLRENFIKNDMNLPWLALVDICFYFQSEEIKLAYRSTHAWRRVGEFTEVPAVQLLQYLTYLECTGKRSMSERSQLQLFHRLSILRWPPAQHRRWHGCASPKKIRNYNIFVHLPKWSGPTGEFEEKWTVSTALPQRGQTEAAVSQTEKNSVKWRDRTTPITKFDSI